MYNIPSSKFYINSFLFKTPAIYMNTFHSETYILKNIRIDETARGQLMTLLNGIPIPVKDSAMDLGVNIDSTLKFHQHIRNVVQKTGGMTQHLLKSTVNRDASFLIPLYVTHIKPILEYCSSVWNLGYIADINLFESVQRRWTKNIRGMEHLDYSQRLKALDLYSVQGRK